MLATIEHPNGNGSDPGRDQVTNDRRAWLRFAGHYLEMVAAMLVGMFILGGALRAVLAAADVAYSMDRYPELVTLERLCVSSGEHSSALVVGQDATVDGVRQPALQAPARLLGSLALGELAPVVVAAGAGIAGLGDRGDVDGGVELAVASSR
jgi:hypothetical protein